MGYYQDSHQMITKKDIGLAIRTFRKKANLTQGQLGNKLNPKPVRKETISHIETGMSNYGIDTLFRIAEVLNCSISDFFGIKEKSPKMTMMETLLEDLREDMKKELCKECKPEKKVAKG